VSISAHTFLELAHEAKYVIIIVEVFTVVYLLGFDLTIVESVSRKKRRVLLSLNAGGEFLLKD